MSVRPVARVPESLKCTRWVIAKCGSCEIPAYRYSNGKGCFVYYEDGRRVRRAFTDERKGKVEAGLIAARLATGDHRALQLSPLERDSFVIAQSHIRAFDLPLHLGAEEYACARRALPPGVSLAQAVDSYVRIHAFACVTKTVAGGSALARLHGERQVVEKHASAEFDADDWTEIIAGCLAEPLAFAETGVDRSLAPCKLRARGFEHPCMDDCGWRIHRELSSFSC